MPNQLASWKRRCSLAEHRAVLAALAEVARQERTTLMALLRTAVRQAIAERAAADAALASRLRKIAMRHAPYPPKGNFPEASLSRFHRDQREFDQALIDLHLTTPAKVQERNSIVPRNSRLNVPELERRHVVKD